MDEAGISNLPAPILHHILSFLSQKEAVETCVLSKSWRNLVSTLPNLWLHELDFKKDKEKFIDVLDKSLQVYCDQKLCIEELCVFISKVSPEFVLLLQKWIPLVIVKKFYLSFSGEYSDPPSAVFESESLQEITLDRCNLSQINNYIGNNNHHLKTLVLQDVCIKEETSFAKFLSSFSSIEHLSLRFCQGLRTLNMNNHHNLKRFELQVYYGDNIEIYFPSTIGYIKIYQCPNWFQHRNYFPGLTCLKLTNVPLSKEWFNSFSRNFPCLEKLRLRNCNGFDEIKLSSRSIKKLDIKMHKSTIKATIDTPNIIDFHYHADISQSIYINTTTSSEWNSHIYVSLHLDASQWFLKLSELVAAFSQSQINSLELSHSYDKETPDIEHLSDISISCGSYKMPVAVKRLSLHLSDRYYDSFFSDLVIGLFRFVRPREIRQYRKDEFLCRTLQMSFWQHDLEQVSLEVKNIGTGSKEWHSVQGTINWSEYVAALHGFYKFRFRLKWRRRATFCATWTLLYNLSHFLFVWYFWLFFEMFL